MTPAFRVGLYAGDLVAMSCTFGAISRIGRSNVPPILRFALLGLVAIANGAALLSFECAAATMFALALITGVAAFALPSAMVEPLELDLGKWKLPLFLAAVGSSAALAFIHLPVATFLSAPDEFAVGLDVILSVNGMHLMTSVYAAALAYGLAAAPGMRSVLAFVALLTLGLSLVYSFVYPFGYPLMTGFLFEQTRLESAVLARRIAVDTATIAALGAGLRFALKRFGARRIFVAIVVLDVSLAISSFVRVERDPTHVAAAVGRVSPPVAQRPLQYAKGKENVLILFLDRFMGGFVETIMEQEPSLAARLDGFTWYPRTIGAGQNTIAGFHPILGGYDYMPREMTSRKRPLRDVAAESYAILPFNFTTKGYGSNLVNPRGLGFTSDGDCTFIALPGRCARIAPAVQKRFALEYGIPLTVLDDAPYYDVLAFLGAMRIAPYGLREIVNRRGLSVIASAHSAASTLKEWAELKALPDLSSTDADRGQLDILINALPHEPFFMGKDCVPRTQAPTIEPEEVGLGHDVGEFEVRHFVTAKCTLELVADYFDWMRQAGVYDVTKIVVVSDHGVADVGSGTVKDRSKRAVAGGTTDNLYARTRTLLLVKERNAHGALVTSEEYLPNAEVPRIVCKELGGCVNPYLENRPIEALGRDVPFVVTTVPFQYALQIDAYEVQREDEVDGRDPFLASNWRRIR